MGSVKKKVNKVFNKAADKLIPKELAPFLPYASMLLPFLGPMAGIMGSTVGRYAIPQLLTALGSAKSTGEVDLKKQALAAASSYLGGPGDKANNMEKAYMDANPNTDAFSGVPDAISGGPIRDFSQIDPKKLEAFSKTYKPSMFESAQDFGTGLQRVAGSGGSGGSEGFFKQASLIGAPMMTMGGIDMAESEIKKQKEKKEASQAAIGNYKDSSKLLGDYYADMEGDYDRLYGGLDFGKRFMRAANGGRVGMNVGGVPDALWARGVPDAIAGEPDLEFQKFMNQMWEAAMKERPTGIPEGAGSSSMPLPNNMLDKIRNLTTPARTGLEALSEKMNPLLQKFQKPGLEEEELLRKLQREEQDMSRQEAESSLSKMFFGLMGRPEDQYNQGGRVGMNMGGNPGDDISPARMKEFVDFALSNGDDMEAALEYAKRMAVGETQLNQGGRVGYNQGGSSGMSLLDNQGGLTGFGGKVKDQMGLAGLFELYNLLGPALGMNQGGRVRMNEGGSETDYEKPFNIDYGPDNRSGPMTSVLNALTNMAPGDFIDKGIVGIRDFFGIESEYEEYLRIMEETNRQSREENNMGGRVGYNMGGMGSIPQTPTVPQGMQLNGQGGGFIPMGAQEKKDDVPAMLAKNEFVMTSDAVRAAGGGSIEKGAQKMYDVMNNLEAQV